MNYTVRDAPIWLRGPVWVYGFSTAALLWVFLRVYRLTLRIEFHGRRDARIEALWHEDLLLYFLTFTGRPGESIWMQHPALYMRPVHLLLRWRGVTELAYGSSGHDGQTEGWRYPRQPPLMPRQTQMPCMEWIDTSSYFSDLLSK